MKIKFNLDNKLPLNKTIKFPSIIIVVRTVFLKVVFLGECLYKL